MNRADRRRQQREVTKNQVSITQDNFRNLLSKFNERDFKLIDGIIENRVSKILEESSYILDMIYSTKLSELGFSWEETEKFNDEVTKMFKEDRERLKKITEELGKDCDAIMTKMAKDVETRIKELTSIGIAKKEVIETILFEFPKLTKSMATSTYSKVNSDLKKEEKQEQAEEDPEIKQGLEYIFEEEKEMNNKTVEEVKVDKVVENKEVVNPVVVTKATVEQANLNPPVENKAVEQSKFQIKSMIVEGNNGIYSICPEGVELRNDGGLLCFENVKELDKFYKEYKEAFGLMKA